MIDHIGDATEKVDLDALEKLADEGLRLATGPYTEKGVYRHAAIKALIAELKEARGLITDIAASKITEDNPYIWKWASEVMIKARAFLARNGKGEG